MRLHRFFLSGENWDEKKIRVVSPAVSAQLLNVLRFKVGSQLVALDNTGFEYLCEVSSDRPLELAILKKEQNKNEPPHKIVIYQSIIKKDNFEWVLQKGTEVGVSQFVPILCQRCEKKEVGRPERMNLILREAAEQSARGKIPLLSPMVSMQEVIAAPTGSLNLMLDPASDTPLSRYFPAIPAYNQINLLVGPEGGLAPEEIAAAKAGGWEGVNLGPRILRTETAGLLAAGAILIATQG